MTTKRILIVATIALSSALISSCKKEGCTDATATNYSATATEDDGGCEYATPQTSTPGNITPVFEGDYAALVGIKTITTIEQSGFVFDQETGVAVAIFSENGEFVNAGTVNSESEVLAAQPNNSYVFTPSATAFTGIEFSGATDWSASGGTWPAVEISNNDNFSTVNVLNSSSTVSSNEPFTLSTSGVTGADSVYFGIYGTEEALIKVLAGNATSHTFTADEVATLGAGSGYTQIVGITYNEQISASRTYWLMNETVRTSTVTIE